MVVAERHQGSILCQWCGAFKGFGGLYIPSDAVEHAPNCGPPQKRWPYRRLRVGDYVPHAR